ncbi:MAG: colanic acid biosynthesis acetyltransferase WcaF [Bacteroidetes bacterium]|nr:colanic acid biosynthesis acetyltransferase WcaF [Bacteroidota bacterium]
MNRTDLSSFNNTWFKPGGNALKRLCWYFTNAIWFNSAFPVSRFKVFLLRLFGAKIGKGVVIKPRVNIKYPWKLSLGNNVWIGEEVWIDNLGNVTIGDSVCLSQGAMLLCGNHDYKKQTFDLVVRDIVLEDGVWIGAKATVCPGMTCHSHSVLAVGSVATSNLEAYKIYQGNPATIVRERKIQ